ncbi:hypothetical protein BH11ARM1_BH11ARM1_14540 [soil metagenome]
MNPSPAPLSQAMIARIALTFSLLLVLVASGFAQYSELSRKINAAPDNRVASIVAASKAGQESDIRDILSGKDKTDVEVPTRLRTIVALRAMLEGPAKSSTVESQVKEIKSAALYRDPGVDETSSWLTRALERLKNIHFDPPKMSGPAWSMPLLGPILYYLMWFLICLAVAFLIFLGVRHFNWQRRLSRKASAMLEEDEPERTLDEWLERAKELEAQGKFREAVRALYLASLLRFDEALIARFDRGQTNWEQLARIEKSPKLPVGLDFRPATQHFDRVWYGHIVQGAEDVAAFRQTYISVTDALTKRAA